MVLAKEEVPTVSRDCHIMANALLLSSPLNLLILLV